MKKEMILKMILKVSIPIALAVYVYFIMGSLLAILTLSKFAWDISFTSNALYVSWCGICFLLLFVIICQVANAKTYSLFLVR